MAGEYTFHGVKATEQQVVHEAPKEARSGIPFVVGTAPVHAVGGKVNKPVLCASFEDAQEQLGYSDDWDSYTLCQVMDMHFRKYGAQPVVFVNVLDPKTMKAAVEAAPYSVSEEHTVALPYNTLRDTLVVSMDDAAAVETIAAVNAVMNSTVGQKAGLKGCTVAFSEASRTLDMVLTGPANGVKNTGIFDALKALIADGCSVAIEGREITGLADFTATEAYGAIAAMTAGSTNVSFQVTVTQNSGTAVEYTVVVSYPDETAGQSGTAEPAEADASVPQVQLTAGVDFDVLYDVDAEVCLIELLEDGAAYDAKSLAIGYDQVTPDSVTKKHIIGGKDAVTRAVSGFEVLEYVYHMVGLAPDLLLCPKWSRDPEVALVMAAKAAEINCVFRGFALADIDSDVVRNYEDLEAYKAEKGLNVKKLINCWPMDKYGGKQYDLSVALAGTMAVTDMAEGNIPCASPSNRKVLADAACLADGTEIMLNVNEASRINHLGAVTILTKFIEGNTIYGDKTACWPEESDPQNGDIAGGRMFAFICNNLVVKAWNKVDKRLTRRLIQSVVDEINLWLNGLAADEKILGGRVEFLAAENPTEDIARGLIRYHVYLGTAPTGRSIEFIVEQDLSYLDDAIASLAS